MFEGIKKRRELERKLAFWQERFLNARDSYAPQLSAMERREELKSGSKRIKRAWGTGGARDAVSVRNIVYELIEAQVDCEIPQPKVGAPSEGLKARAKALEDKLRFELDRLPFEAINDLQERVCTTQGGAFVLVEWDNSRKTHNTVGEIVLTPLHPKQVIPQPGVWEIEASDYIFVTLKQTADFFLREFGTEIEGETETQVKCYYKNGRGGIGLFSWVGDTVLEDREDYQARYYKKCAVCGEETDGVCRCGSEKFYLESRRFEVTAEDIRVGAGDEEISIPRGTVLPCFTPNMYPLVLRRNVSCFGQLLGSSDVDMIEDQQEGIKKLDTAILEKLLKGGSYVTLPKNYSIKTDDANLKIIPIKNPQDKSMIDVITVQPDVEKDMKYAEELYQQARNILGITDSYQGKQDPTATSGKAKEISASQTAGRLRSKRVMKKAFYADLFKVMAMFLIAYSDDVRPYCTENADGEKEYCGFSKYLFLEKDEAGEWFYNTDFLFSTDSGDLYSSRQSMWQEARQNLATGAFGDPKDLKTLLAFWRIMEGLHYPNAGRLIEDLEDRMKEVKV